MIAVFCKSLGEFNSLEFTPKKEFMLIRGVSDIYQRMFTGVVKTKGFSRHNSDQPTAYLLLKSRQPELFDDL